MAATLTGVHAFAAAITHVVDVSIVQGSASWHDRSVVVLPDELWGTRVTLRRWRPGDVAIVRAAIEASIEHLRPWMAWIAHEPMADEDRRGLIDRWDADWRAGGDAVFGVFLGDAVVGGCGLHRRRGPETLEVGYWIHADHVRQGFATEIARVLTDAALSVPGITRVEIHHDAANVASRGVPEALGYRFDGDTPTTPVAPGEVGIDVCWSITTENWRQHPGGPTR